MRDANTPRMNKPACSAQQWWRQDSPDGGSKFPDGSPGLIEDFRASPYPLYQNLHFWCNFSQKNVGLGYRSTGCIRVARAHQRIFQSREEFVFQTARRNSCKPFGRDVYTPRRNCNIVSLQRHFWRFLCHSCIYIGLCHDCQVYREMGGWIRWSHTCKQGTWMITREIWSAPRFFRVQYRDLRSIRLEIVILSGQQALVGVCKF